MRYTLSWKWMFALNLHLLSCRIACIYLLSLIMIEVQYVRSNDPWLVDERFIFYFIEPWQTLSMHVVQWYLHFHTIHSEISYNDLVNLTISSSFLVNSEYYPWEKVGFILPEPAYIMQRLGDSFHQMSSVSKDLPEICTSMQRTIHIPLSIQKEHYRFFFYHSYLPLVKLLLERLLD